MVEEYGRSTAKKNMHRATDAPQVSVLEGKVIRAMSSKSSRLRPLRVRTLYTEGGPETFEARLLPALESGVLSQLHKRGTEMLRCVPYHPYTGGKVKL